MIQGLYIVKWRRKGQARMKRLLWLILFFTALANSAFDSQAACGGPNDCKPVDCGPGMVWRGCPLCSCYPLGYVCAGTFRAPNYSCRVINPNANVPECEMVSDAGSGQHCVQSGSGSGVCPSTSHPYTVNEYDCGIDYSGNNACLLVDSYEISLDSCN